MDVRWVTPDGVERRDVGDLPSLLRAGGGFVWLDVADHDERTEKALTETFGFHPMAVQACRERSHVPRLRTYADHVFVVLLAPERGEPGHLHLVELDLFVGLNYLVTVHGPLGEGVAAEVALRETTSALRRLEDGRHRPSSPAELCWAIASRIASRMEALVDSMATAIAGLERRVMKSEVSDPERTLEEMFLARHELVTLRTMAAHSREVCARMAALSRLLPAETHPLIEDLVDRFERITSQCDGEKEFLAGVVDFFQSLTSTRMNTAMERLALISALVLPVTAIASIYGMNVIVNNETDPVQVAGVLAAMLAVGALMLRWARRHGWW